jgi:Uma2 family endonuclease
MYTATAPATIATQTDYIAHEEAADVRHEWINQTLIEMPGTSDQHNEVTGNFYIAFKYFFKNTRYKVFMENVKLKTDDTHYFYPDVFVVDNEHNTDKYIKTNALIIVEVLSQSTRAYDMVEKFVAYKTLDTLQYYILVEPEKTLIHFYYKTPENTWDLQVFTDINDTISLDTFGFYLPLQDIYA